MFVKGKPRKKKIWKVEKSEFLNTDIFETVLVVFFIMCRPNFNDTETWGQFNA